MPLRQTLQMRGQRRSQVFTVRRCQRAAKPLRTASRRACRRPEHAAAAYHSLPPPNIILLTGEGVRQGKDGICKKKENKKRKAGFRSQGRGSNGGSPDATRAFGRRPSEAQSGPLTALMDVVTPSQLSCGLCKPFRQPQHLHPFGQLDQRSKPNCHSLPVVQSVSTATVAVTLRKLECGVQCGDSPSGGPWAIRPPRVGKANGMSPARRKGSAGSRKLQP